MARFGNDALVLNKTADIVLGGYTSISASINPNVSTPESATAYPLRYHVMTQQPEASFTTVALRECLDNIGVTGECFAAGKAITSVELYQARRDPCTVGGRSSGSDHMEFKLSSGHVLIDSINLPAGAYATANLSVHATSLAAVTFNKSLPTVASGTHTTGWRLGHLELAGLGIGNVTDITINYNHSIEKPIYAGENKYPNLVDIVRTAPMISISLESPLILDATNFGASGLANGLTCTHANSLIYIIQQDEATPGTTAHMTCSFAGLCVPSNIVSASGSSAATTALEVYCIDDGTNTPILWDTTAAFPGLGIDV